MEEINNVTQLDSVEVLRTEAALSLITRAEIDTQISTAQAFPRSIKRFMDQTLTIATVNEDVAQSCTFKLPRGGKILEGKSVRLAEIVVSTYRNIRAGMRVIRNDGRSITAQGICHDLECNSCVTLEVTKSLMQNVWETDPATNKKRKTGRMVPMNEDMQVMTGNAACAIAFRNVVFKIVPGALIEDIYEKIKEVAIGSAETMPARREKTLKYLYSKEVTDKQICAVLEIVAVEDIDIEKLSILRGMCSLIKNGENTAAELFSELDTTSKAKGEGLNAATEQAIKDQQNKANANKRGKAEDKSGEGSTTTPPPEG